MSSTDLLSGLRVMVVEDEGLIGEELRHRLSRLGMVVVATVDSAESAVAAAIQLRPDVVLMDIQIKGERDGVEAAAEIGRTIDIPIVYLTAHSDRATFDRAKATAAFGYVLKPFQERELMVAIEVAVHRHAIERQLRDSERKYVATLASIRDGVIVTDLAGRITFMNPAAEALTAYQFVEGAGQALEVVFRLNVEGAQHTVEPPVARVLREGAIVRVTDRTELIARDGRSIPIAVSGAPIWTEQRVLGGIVVVFRDVTLERHGEAARLRAMELESENRNVREASRLKSAFLANMSHELRTPLNSIIGFSQLIQRGPRGPIAANQGEYLTNILASAQQLLRLISGILDLAKVESGKMAFTPESLDLDALIGDVCRRLRPQAEEKRIALVIQTDPQVRHVVLDLVSLTQVLNNYLSNALKFTPGGGRITIRTGADGAQDLRIEVEDTGIGILAADIGRLFTEFEQLEAGRATVDRGSGLGLALTKRLVESQGGYVGVRSTPERGSVFFAVLPGAAVSGRSPVP